MPTLERLAADLLLVVHLGFVLFVIFGGLLALRRLRWAWLHLPALTWGVLIEVNGWICPLTAWEDQLRGRSDNADFVERIVVPILYPPGLDGQDQTLLAVLLLGFNLVVYGLVVRSARRKRPETEVRRDSARR